MYLKDNINKRTGKGEGFWRRKKPCCPFPSHAALSHQSHFKPTHSIFYLFIYLFLIFKIFSNQPIKNCRHKLTRAPHHTLIILPYFENQIQSLSLSQVWTLSNSYVFLLFSFSLSLSLSLTLTNQSLCFQKTTIQLVRSVTQWTQLNSQTVSFSLFSQQWNSSLR